MRVTTWTEYSLIISLHLARRGRSGVGPVAARELADQERLPADYVEQILLRLRRAGLVESVRGAKGGYLLAREPAEISVRDVMAASEHQTFEINCDSHPVDAERCSPGSGCSIRPVWQALQQRVDDLLAGISLADLMKQEAQLKEAQGRELVSISSAG
jgi:Rrf2 family transcriptional regulator, iron-sulfur cluster assembly transcription factor